MSAVIPACEEASVKMAIHPDDPPWEIFGLPRIITGEKSWANGRKGRYPVRYKTIVGNGSRHQLQQRVKAFGVETD